MNEQVASSFIWREAFTVIRRYPLATLMPAAVLGTLGEAPAYFIEDHPALDQVVTYLTAALAYYLYLAYAEQVSAEAERRVDRITLRDMLHLLRQAIPFVPRVLVAASVTFSISSFATGLLVLPGAWLFTRWSLSTPVITNEDLGPVAALKRSNEIVRGHFWFVFTTATLAFVLEELVPHVGELVGLLVTGSSTWGEWIGGSIPASMIIPLAALTTSRAYVRLTTCAQSLDRV